MTLKGFAADFAKQQHFPAWAVRCRGLVFSFDENNNLGTIIFLQLP